MEIRSLNTYSGQKIELNKLTILVGPNNSGKSQTLRDIKERMDRGMISHPKIFHDINFIWPKTFAEMISGTKIIGSPSNIGSFQLSGIGSNLMEQHSLDFPERLVVDYDNNQYDPDTFLGQFTRFRIAYLNSENRLRIGSQTASIHPKKDQAENLLQTLVQDIETEKQIKEAFLGAFGMEIMFDPTGFREFCFRVGDSVPDVTSNIRLGSDETEDLQQLDDQGDGFRSFVGIVLGLLKTKDRIILLDEPEAFLHPAQARYLGYWISQNVKLFSSQIIIATHSSNFLSGILAGENTIDIYRLNRSGDETKFHLIPPDATKSLSTHPTLSSQRILEAIFHKGVVVCEADSDKAVYQGVSSVHFENQEILFVHSHNKQTLKIVVELLRNASIPVAAITDIDFLNDELVFVDLIEKFIQHKIDPKLKQLRKEVDRSINSIPDEVALENLLRMTGEFLKQKHSLSGSRSALSRILKDSSKWSKVKKHGIVAFDKPVKESAEQIFEYCKSIGLFIVPVGELEGWIKLEYTKSKWIVPALEIVSNGSSSKPLITFISEVLDYFKRE